MLSLVTTIATETNGSFTLKQFSAYTKKHGKYVNTMFETLFARAKDEISHTVINEKVSIL